MINQAGMDIIGDFNPGSRGVWSNKFDGLLESIPNNPAVSAFFKMEFYFHAQR